MGSRTGRSIAADRGTVGSVDPQFDTVLPGTECAQRQEMSLVEEILAIGGIEPDAARTAPIHLDDDLRVGTQAGAYPPARSIATRP